jgi:hypothetical protein
VLTGSHSQISSNIRKAIALLRPDRKYSIVITVATFLVALTACSVTTPSVATGSPATQKSSPPVQQPSPAVTEAAPVVPAPIAANTWHFENATKYTFNLTIQMWAPIVGKSQAIHPADRSFALTSVCPYDPTLDVAIPVEWQATATTKGFSVPLSADAIFSSDISTPGYSGSSVASPAYAGKGVAPFDGDSRVDVYQQFSSGPKCSKFSSNNIWGYGHSDGFGVSWDSVAVEGTSASQLFFVIVHNYFSPATPNGDPALLNWITLRPIFTGGNLGASGTFVDADGASLGVYSNKGISLAGTVR